MRVNLPGHLYKYLPLSRTYGEEQKTSFDVLADLLIRGLIWYSKPQDFNDPFEIEGIRIRLSKKEIAQLLAAEKRRLRLQISPDIDRDAAEAKLERMAAIEIEKAQAKQDEDKSTLIHRCGFISLCGSSDNPLMWSHYADHHRGICLRIRAEPDPFFEEDGNGRVLQVSYSDEIETHEVSYEEAEAVFVQVSRKGKCWEYEDEYRVYKLPSAHNADDAQGNHPFNSSLVDGIFFGIKTSEEDIEQVKDVVGNAGHEIELFRAIRHPDRLAIDFEELT